MKTTRLGCFTGTGIAAALITALIVLSIVYARGGAMFSPGALNDVPGAGSIGGVLTHARTGGRCRACHTAIWDRETMSDRCLVCHSELLVNDQSFHAAMLAQAAQANCQHCHTDHRGAQASLIMMDVSNFPHGEAAGYSLQGHQKTASGAAFACTDCHGTDIGKFDLATCATCHQQVDSAFMADHTAAFGSACLDCHDGVDRFGQTFDHNAIFPLQGRHAQTACQDCHMNARSQADLQSAPQSCYGCHSQDDEHNGQFGQDCAACHTPDSWENATFDHSKSAFPLVGQHAQVECSACHQNNVFKGTRQDCFACHAQDDEHNGQFGQDCAACHTPDSWENATFDHSKSAFPLVGQHAQVECGACHLNNVFKGTPQDCFSCHAQDDEHNGQFGQDCAACHTPDSWENATFDHSLSQFALTGAHVQVECAQCHVNQVFKDTPTECAACHADPGYHQGMFGTDCAACHSTNAWSPASFNGPHQFPINHGESGSSQCQVCHPSALSSYTCYGCHEHNQAGIASKHREEGIADFNDCMRCHPTGREEEGRGGD